MTVTGEQAVKAGATDEQLTDLVAPFRPTSTPRDVSAKAAELEATRMRVRDMARKINATRNCVVAPPKPVCLTHLLEQPDDGLTYRVVDLWPSGGRVLLAAPYKAGKSTMVGNVIRALVDGDRFLGRSERDPGSQGRADRHRA